MVPAHQRLEAADLAGAEIDLRLVDHGQFVAQQGGAQIVLDQALLAHGNAHFRLEETVHPAAVLLGAVERGVGIGDELLGGGGVGRIERDADRDRDEGTALAGEIRLLKRFQDGFGDTAGAAGLVDLGHDDGELVAAEPGAGLARVEHFGEALGDAAQHGIAGAVPEQVVDLLEAVEIEAQHGKPVAAALGLGYLLVQLLVEGGAVGEAGERIVVGEEAQLLLVALARRQVAHGEGGCGMTGIDDLARDHLDGQLRAVGAPDGGLVGGAGMGHQLVERFRLQQRIERGAGEPLGILPGQRGEGAVCHRDAAGLGDGEAFDGSFGQRHHAVGLDGRAAFLARIEPQRTERGGDNDGADQRDPDRQQRRGDVAAFDDGEAIVEIGRTHAGEMHGADGDGQQRRAAQAPAQPLQPPHGEQRQPAEDDAEDDRGRDQAPVPHDLPADNQRGHAGIMHAGDADADDATAQRHIGWPPRDGGEQQPATDDQEGGDQRQRRQAEIVAGGQVLAEGQHGDEMRGPHPEADGNGPDPGPAIALRPLGAPGPVQQADPGKGGGAADDGGEHDQFELVLEQQRGNDVGHVRPPGLKPVARTCEARFVNCRTSMDSAG